MKTLVYLILVTAAIAVVPTSKLMAGEHKIPFASQNNAIELSVANTATVDAGDVTVEIVNPPQWLKFTNPKIQIPNLKSNKASIAQFTFSTDKSAPVGKEQKLQFIISTPAGEKWTKEISIQVSPPEKFELYQNYPNPFNPSTTISFLLPAAGQVSLKVFDVVGREVKTLFEGMKEPGFHEERFDAKNYATGMYIYQVAIKNDKGTTEYFRKKMLMLK